jgi:DNA-directed RNA polymerase subunit K/omega
MAPKKQTTTKQTAKQTAKQTKSAKRAPVDNAEKSNQLSKVIVDINKFVVDNDIGAQESAYALTEINYNNLVPPEERITQNILTEYEYTQVISLRAEQVQNNLNENKQNGLFIALDQLDKNRTFDPVYIATEEFRHNLIPFFIVRKIGDSRCELFHLIKDKMIYLS